MDLVRLRLETRVMTAAGLRKHTRLVTVARSGLPRDPVAALPPRSRARPCSLCVPGSPAVCSRSPSFALFLGAFPLAACPASSAGPGGGALGVRGGCAGPTSLHAARRLGGSGGGGGAGTAAPPAREAQRPRRPAPHAEDALSHP